MNPVDDAGVGEYRERYTAWQQAAAKVLTAQSLIRLAGGYKEAFVLLDAILFVDIGNVKKCRDTSDLEMQYADKVKACERTTRTILAAQKLAELASGQEEAFMLLDAVLIVTEGRQAHGEIAETHRICGRHHQLLAEEAKEQGE